VACGILAPSANEAATIEIGKAMRPGMHGSNGMCVLCPLWAANAQTARWFNGPAKILARLSSAE
jgi:hypothetical protein